jgi:pilus assembly protein CpaB
LSTTNKIIVAILVLLAIGLGAFGYYMANRSLSAHVPTVTLAGAPAKGAGATFPVVVAATPLLAGQPIGKDAVKVLQYPQMPDGAMSQVSQAIGQVPQTGIGVGVPVLQAYLLSGLAMHVQNGYRAVAIHVDKVVAVGDHLHPGDYVDLFFTLPAAQSYGTGPQQQGPAQSRMLLSELRVLAVGPQTVAKALPVAQSTNAFGPAGQQPQNPNQAPPTPPTSVVLQVPTGDVAKLAIAEESGKLMLALRNPEDINQPDKDAFPSAPPALAPELLPLAKRKDALQIPDNKAYAGLTLPGLRGHSLPSPVYVAHGYVAPKPVQRMEIYRGDQKQSVAY